MILLLWISIITAFLVLSAWEARRTGRPDALYCLYSAVVIFSVIAAGKIAQVDLFFGRVYVASGVFTYALTFLLTDIVNEKFGRKMTHRMVFITFLCLVAESFFSWLVVWVKPAPFWNGQPAYDLILGQVPRIVLAGWLAFLTSENLDAYIFDKFKKITKGKHLWMRNVFSSLPAMVVDSIVFVSVAFYGKQPIGQIIFGVTVVKWLIGVINIPFMYLNRWILFRGSRSN